ncbi:alpha/beta fold hydrolase [Mucilaginibacter sp. HD30]
MKQLILMVVTGMILSTPIRSLSQTPMKEVKESLGGVELFHRFKLVNGINMHYVEAGQGPLVILIHGFPELWYSWRSQIPAIAKAGFHVVAVDLRGYGQSTVTADVSSYSIVNQVKDINDLIDGLHKRQAILIGHDWGANIAYAMTMLNPEKVKALVTLSVPFYPQPIGPVARIKEFSKDKFNFVVYFQQPGLAEKEINADVSHFFKRFFYALSGTAPDTLVNTLFTKKSATTKLLDEMPEPKVLPAWLTEKELAYYTNSFKKTGFTGALNIYRNIDRDFAALQGRYKPEISQPSLFIAGQNDAAIKFGSLEATKKGLSNLKGLVILPHTGHWVQQEQPKEVNDAIVGFLKQL